MPWFRIEDRFADHPKVHRGQRRGRAVGQLRHVLVTVLDRWAGARRDRPPVRQPSRDRTAGVGRLWVPTDDGFVMPDFLDYNPSVEQVKLARKRDAEKKRRQRENVDRSTNGQYVSRRESPGDEP